MNLRGSALWYARRNIPVFPLKPRDKVPATSHGFKDATTDPAKVKQWWATNPEYNIGLATGHLFDVVDCDGPKGRESIEPYLATLPIIGRATTAREDGGEHLYIPATGWGNNNREYKRQYPGLDYRGNGGYVVAPPSIGATGRAYKWISNPDFDHIPAPDLEHPFFAPFRSRVEDDTPQTVQEIIESTDWTDWEAERELNAACGLLLVTTEGRNIELNNAAFLAGRLVSAGRISESVALERLTLTVERVLPDELQKSLRTIESGFSAGMKDPKYRSEDFHEETPTGPTSGRVNFYEEWDKAEDDIPWIIWPIVAERRLTALYSVPKVGKSLLALDAVIKVSKGEPFLGHEPINGPVTVLYLDKENDVRGDVIQRAKNMGYEAKDFDNIAYYSFHDLPSMDTEAGGKKVLALAQEHNAGLVVVDTVSRHVVGEENSNDTWLAWYRCTGALLKQHGIACIRIDHAGKDAAKGQRGGSSKSGDVDMIWQMSLTREDVVRLKLDSQRMQVPTEYRDITVERVADPLRHEVIDDPAPAINPDAGSRSLAEAKGLTPYSSVTKVKKEMGWGYDRAKKFLEDWQHHTETMGTGQD